jgi:DNA-binding transcriptional LysR family regulator
MPNIRNVDLNLLVVFDALFDERSVTRAAARLARTQSAVSGMLAKLRRTFSDQLFVRTSHGILPTRRAEALAGPVKDLLASAQSLVTADAFDPATAEGVIRLCGSDYLQHAAMTPLISEVRRRAPKMRLLVAPRPATGVADMLARGEIDLCLSLRELAIPDLPARVLYRDRYICVARKKHPLRGPRITTKQLCTFDHLMVDPTGRSFVGPVDAALAARGHQRRVACAVPSFPVLLEVLQFSDFFAFVPDRFLQKRRSDLKTFQTDLAVPPVEVIANWHPRAAGDSQHKWLRDLLVDVLKTPTQEVVGGTMKLASS